MSTATIAAPAAKTVPQEPKDFTLYSGEEFDFKNHRLSAPLSVRLVRAEVSPFFFSINGKDMNPSWLKQTDGPPHDPLAHQSKRLRGKVKTMPRSEYRWTYTIPGIVRFILAEVDGKRPGVHFHIDSTYA